MNSLESRNYVATAADIAALATAHSTALSTQDSTRGVYLRALIATTQADLGIPVRKRNVKAAEPLSDDARKVQASALDGVHKRFYDAVLKALNDVPAKERNQRSTFARTALSTLRAWMRAGNDIGTLAAARVTKASLRLNVPVGKKKAASGAAAARIVERLVLVTAALDKDTAVGVLEGAMAKIMAQLQDIGGAVPTSKPEKALQEHRPFTIKSHGVTGTFWPVSQTVPEIRVNN